MEPNPALLKHIYAQAKRAFPDARVKVAGKDGGIMIRIGGREYRLPVAPLPSEVQAQLEQARVDRKAANG